MGHLAVRVRTAHRARGGTQPTNRVYQLQASADLVAWTTLTNCTDSGSCAPIEYVDPEAPAAGMASYYQWLNWTDPESGKFTSTSSGWLSNLGRTRQKI